MCLAAEFGLELRLGSNMPDWRNTGVHSSRETEPMVITLPDVTDWEM